MENQHQHIKGYRDLTQEEIDLMNEVKTVGEAVGALVDKISAVDGADVRWASIARTQLQQGLMALTRAIAKPESF